MMGSVLERLQEGLSDRYRLERELGRGGMATVYLARDLKHDRPVALKVMHPELAHTLGPERFLREIRTTARLDHPHILPVLDSGEAGGLLWYTMPFIEGESLRERLRREKQLPVDEAVRLAREVADALDCAHEHGVVHRDIKPENILLARNHARVADFGVARALEAAGGAGLTESGMTVGTPQYMAPEQAAGGEVDARTDVYALGCVLYEMLAGEPPYTGPTAQAVLAKRVLEPVPHVRTLRDTVPERVEQAVTQALAKLPADRFPSASAFGQHLESPDRLPVTVEHSVRELHPGNRVKRLITIGLAVAAVAAVMISQVAQHHASAGVEPNLVAVAPFDVLDPKLPLWREGLVDLLSRNLDGAGPLRTVSPTVVVRRWSGRADRTSAEELAKRTGAGLALYGTLVGSGRDSVRLTASLIDLSRQSTVGETELRGPVDQIDRLADSLAVRMLRGLGESRPIGAVRAMGLGANSMDALRAFLRGEQFFRRTEWDSALTKYEQAVTLDSNFALAYRRLGTVRGWRYGIGDSLSESYALRAGTLNHGLPPRDSLLVICDSLMGTLPEGGMRDSVAREQLRRLFEAAETVTRRYPSDPEAWTALGEASHHFGHGLGVNDSMELQAFQQAIALDSAFAPAYIHVVDLAVILDDRAAARRYADLYLALRPSGETARLVRVIRSILDSTSTIASTDRLLDTLPTAVLHGVWLTWALAIDSAEVGVRAIRRLATRRIAEEVWYRDSLERQGLLASTLAHRGHLEEATRVVHAAPQLVGWPVFTELALLGAMPREEVDSAFRRLYTKGFWPAFQDGLAGAPPWWGSQGDTAALKRYVEQLNWRARLRSAPPGATKNPYWLAAAEAYLTLARYDTASAIHQFSILPDSTGFAWLERLTLARLLASRGRDREALQVLDREFPYAHVVASRPMWALERARLAERLGERRKAQRWYGYVTAAWGNGDELVRPWIGEAREALKRLASERVH
jgi:serine/threonine-protein kinase